jgi:hypothetical protein
MAEIKLTITFNSETQAIGIQAPQDNMLALGMLGLAKSYISSRIEWGQSPDRKIIPFGGPIPPLKKQ